jgi:RNA polymerase nonessential primary-like sigma factor
MYDPAAPEELENPEPDLPPEVEVFLEVPAASPDTDFLGDVTQLYLNEIGANPLLTAEEELALSRRVRLGDFEARQIMIERNLRLVVNIAKHYLNRGMPAARSGRGGQPRPHPCPREVRSRARLPLLHLCHLVDPPEHRAGDHEPVAHHPPAGACGEGTQSGAACPASAGGCRQRRYNARRRGPALDRPVADVRAILALNEHTASLDAPLDIDPTLSIGESLADDEADTPDVQIQDLEVETLVREWIGQLSEKQRLVIRHRYGLDECEVRTLEELADSLDLTRERVRQIQLEALGQLRRIIKRRGVSKDVLL